MDRSETAAGDDGVDAGDTSPMMSFRDKRLLLGTLSELDELPEGAIDALAGTLQEWHAEPGEVLIQEGGVVAQVFIVIEGRAVVSREGRTLAVVGSGSVIGDLRGRRPADQRNLVRAITPMRLLIAGLTQMEGLTRLR